MNCNEMTIPKESEADRLHREYAWSKRDGDITRNGVVYRWWLAGPSGAGFKLFREPHHTDADIQQAEDELRARRDVVELRVAKTATAFDTWPQSDAEAGCNDAFGLVLFNSNAGYTTELPMAIDQELASDLRDPQSEDQVVGIIKSHLLKPRHKEKLRDMDLSVADVLNGRFTPEKTDGVKLTFADWNEECGDNLFKF